MIVDLATSLWLDTSLFQKQQLDFNVNQKKKKKKIDKKRKKGEKESKRRMERKKVKKEDFDFLSPIVSWGVSLLELN